MIDGETIANVEDAGESVLKYPRTMGDYKQRWKNAGDDYLSLPEAKAFRLYVMMAQDVYVSDETQMALYYAVMMDDLVSGIREEKQS